MGREDHAHSDASLIAAFEAIDRTDGFEALCRHAVELCRNHFGFDRASLWFVLKDGSGVGGSYGTDENGKLRDERDAKLPMASLPDWADIASGKCSGQYIDDAELRNHRGEVVGRGTYLGVPLRYRARVVGILCLDNLLTHRPVTDRQVEQAILFGAMVCRCCEEARTREQMGVLTFAIEHANQGIAYTDLSGEVVFTNRAFAEMHGYLAEDVVGKEASIFYPPEEMPGVMLANQKMKEEAAFTGDLWHLRRDGTRFLGETTASLICGPDGKPIGYMGTVHDVTETRRLQRLHRLLSSASEQSTEGIELEDLEGNIQYVNEAWARMHGYPREACIGRRAAMVYSRGQAARVKTLRDTVLSEGNYEGELWHRRKDGSDFPVHLSGLLVRDEDGDAVGVVYVFRDITEDRRREREERLWVKQHEMISRLATAYITEPEIDALYQFTVDHLQQILECRTALIGIRDPASGTFCSFFAARHSSAPELTALRDWIQRSSAFQKMLLRDHQWFRSHDLSTPLSGQDLDPGERPAQRILAVPLIGRADETFGVLVVADPTDGQDWRERDEFVVQTLARYASMAALRSRIEATLRQRTGELAKSMETKNRFISMAHHDLGYPLQTILNFLDLFRTGAVDKDTVTRRIEDACLRMSEMIRELLGPLPMLDGKIVLRLRYENFGLLLDHVLAGMAPKAHAKGIRLEREGASAPPFLFDPTRAEEVLMNLVSNGIKFTHPGGKVTVRTAVEKGFLVVQVCDTGQGIPEDEIGRIFEPGAVLSPRPTGDEISHRIGLSVVRHIMEAHGGTITVRSKFGTGSVFTVRFPMESTQEEEDPFDERPEVTRGETAQQD